MKTDTQAAAKSDEASEGLLVRGLRSKLAGPFDLDVERGNAVVVTGPSGSGKSLFLRMLADLDVNEGTVSLGGLDRRAIAAPIWRSMVIYVASESGWWFDTVVEHFSTEHIERAIRFAGELGLSRELLSAQVTQLSSGERQRWALVRAAVQDSKVLLLDEPTGALDQLSVERVEHFLHQLLGKGAILILVTHDHGLADRMGGHRFEMINRELKPL